MAVTVDDISLVLSGGVNNLNPNLSLGGDPSSKQVVSALVNNLFSNVTPDQAEDGYEDYRCFYLFNDSDSTVYNIEIWIESEVENGASLELGVAQADEIQRITISQALPTAGQVTLSYEGHDFDLDAFDDLGEAALSLEASLLSLVDDNDEALLEEVQVTSPSSISSSVYIFDVLFTGKEGSRNHSLIEVEQDAFVPTQTDVTVTVTQDGTPVNTIAPEIATEFTAPPNVSFYSPTQEEPITVYKLKPAEGFPIWLKRSTEEDTASVANDGATLKIRLETISL